MSSFWSIWISVITLGSIFGCWWLLHATRKSQTTDTETERTMGHAYDGIEEYDNPLPKWWLYLFWSTIVFAVVYLLLYPGLGTYKGLLGWTSAGQHQSEVELANKTYGPLYEELAQLPVEELAKEPRALKMGQRLFATNCAVCHGSSATGALGFPNLTDDDWLYGGEPEAIKTTIVGGRNAMMPPRGAAGNLTDNEISQVSHFIRGLSGAEDIDAKMAESGKEVFMNKGSCFACHGQDAKGNQAVGAPNLTDKTWLYGSTQKQVEFTIRNGRNGQMPAFENQLGPEKIHLLSAYVYSLSQKK